MDEADDIRHTLRATFDAHAALYQRTRPVCPDALFDDLMALASLSDRSRVLEIGCGTGQATVPLAQRGLSVIALELGPHLARLARRNVASFAHVSVLNEAFETWDAGSDQFDAVLSVNAFHWIDSGVRFAKAAQLLRDGGSLCIVATHWVIPDGADRFWHDVQDDYEAAALARVDPSTKHPGRIVDWSEAIAASGIFRNVASRSYQFEMHFSADDYADNLRTQTGLYDVEPSAREDLLRRVRQRVRDRGGHVTATFLATLNVATR